MLIPGAYYILFFVLTTCRMFVIYCLYGMAFCDITAFIASEAGKTKGEFPKFLA